MKRKVIFILIAIFSVYSALNFVVFAENQEPDTLIVNPPESDIDYNDLRIWWIGQGQTQIIGFYYQLDGRRYEFSEKNYVTLYDLSDGVHTFRVKAVDENLIEDSSPAIYSFNVSRATNQEAEFNNTDENATQIQKNQTIEGTTETVSDVDWYQFNSQTRVVNILIRREAGVSETKIKVYHLSVSSSTLISEFKINSSNRQRNCLTFGTSAGERYYVKIEPRSFDPDIKKYYLTVNATESINNVFWDTEPNNSPEHATELLVSEESVQNFGFANTNGIVDWYKIHVDSPKLLKMAISRNSATLTPSNVSLYSSPSAQREEKVGSPAMGTLQTAVTLGDYFLRVETNTLDFETPYLIRFKLERLPPNQTAEFEPNDLSPLDDPTSASKLPLDTPLIGSSWDGNEDIDWTVIDVPSSNSENKPMLCLILSRIGGFGRTSIELYNPNLSLLAEGEINPENGQHTTIASRVGLDGGTHYVKLTPQDESPRTFYKLTAFYFLSARHSALEPLGLGETLNVFLSWKPGNSVYFDLVGNFRNESQGQIAPDFSRVTDATERYSSIPMYDDGQHSDGDADDGLYVGQFTPVVGDDVFSAAVLLHVVSAPDFSRGGNRADFFLPGEINIDTSAPEIYSLEHNADAVLVTGEKLIVKLYGEPNLKAEFDISSFLRGIEMYYVGGGGEVPPPLPPGSTQSPPSGLDETNDNYYIGTYTVKPTDRVVNAKISARLIDSAGNVTSQTIEQPITIAGDGPKIYSVEHNASNTSLKLGELLVVTVKTELDANVEFKIADREPILMYDNGMRDDAKARDGIYVGKYKVESKDELESVPVLVSVTKLGASSVIEAADRVTLDGVPPEPVSNVSASDVPDDQGGNLSISWERPADGETVAYYNLYASKTPISSTANREPSSVASVSKSTILPVEENDTSYYVAVTAVDRAGNESKLSAASSAGPVRALDNLPPPPVRIISAFDTPNDFGSQISLEWEDLSNIEDLDHYRIYLSQRADFVDAEVLVALAASYEVPVSADDVDYYFAVTAVDKSGNESEIADYSVVGPVQSRRNIPQPEEMPLKIITGPSGLIRHDDVVFRWIGGETKGQDGTLEPTYIYKLDNLAPNITRKSEIIFSGLTNGEHSFTLKSGEMELSRPFSVNSTTISETEPNNTLSTANGLPLGLTLIGELEKRDLFYFRLPSSGWLDIFINREDIPVGTYPRGMSVSTSLLKDSRKIAEVDGMVLSAGVGAGDYFILLAPGTGEAGQASSDIPVGTYPRGMSYELSATFYPADELQEASPRYTFEIEPNENSTSATPIELQEASLHQFKPVIGSSLVSDDDWFRISVAVPGILAISSSPPDSSLQLKLWNSASALITESPSHLSYSLPSGDYFISVQNRSPTNGDKTVVPFSYHLTSALIDSVRMQISGKQKWWTFLAPTRLKSGASSQGAVSSTPRPELTLGDTLVVEMRFQSGNKASFSIGSIQKNIPLIESFPLADNHGIYVGEYQIPDGIKNSDLPIQIKITDKQNNITRFQPFSLDIDTSSLPITSITHNAETTLREGDILKVTLQAEPDADVSLQITDTAGNNLQKIQNQFSITAQRDGSYIGTYRIQPGDEFVGTLTGKLTRYNGRQVTLSADSPVKVDAVPPGSISNLKAEDVPDDQGFMLNVSWDKSTEPDFSHYEVYLQRAPISAVENATPVLDNLKTNSLIVEVDNNDVRQYLGVVAVDSAGNKSEIATLTEPVSAIDNLAPEPVGVLTARDTPADSGGSITLKWTNPSVAPDFDHYNIYLNRSPFDSALPTQDKPFTPPYDSLSPYTISRHRNLLTVEVSGLSNDVDYYFAVTAVDQSGNESPLSVDSLFGPVSAVDNTTPAVSSIRWLAGPEGIIRYGDVKFVWNRWKGGKVIPRYFYRLDNSVEKITTKTSFSTRNLKDGAHKFSIRGEGDTNYLTKNFVIQKEALDESEPNDTVPQKVEFNLSYLGLLAPQEKDLYLIDKFQSQSSTLFMSINHTSANPVTARIYANGEVIYETLSPSTSIIGINPESEQLVEITGDGGKYELIIDDYKLPEGVFWEIEPNDTQDFATYVRRVSSATSVELIGSASADMVTVGKPLNEALDIDWYYFTITEIKKLSLSCYNTKVVKLYSALRDSLNQIEELSSPSPNQNSFSSELALFSEDVTSQTVYFMEVHSVGDYSIKLSLSDIEPSSYEIEPNDSRLLATSMALEKTISGTSWNNEDEDWYKLNVKNKGTLVLTFDASIGKRETLIYGAEEVPIATSTAGGEFAQRQYIQTDVQAGTYFIHVKPADVEASFGGRANYELLAILVRSAEFSVERTANRPPYVLAEGDLLKVRLVTTAGKSGTFDIGGLHSEIPMTVTETAPMIYAGEYSIVSGDNLESAFLTVNLVVETDIPQGYVPTGMSFNPDGKVVKIALSPPIDIDTKPPTISSVTHSALKPLGTGDELHVVLHGESNESASFQIIGDELVTVPVDMEETEDGVYTGVYVVSEDDNVVNAKLTATLIDRAGNETKKTADAPITLDTTPPEIKMVTIESATQILTDGDKLKVTLSGEKSGLAYFNIGDIASNLRMYDDGEHDDGLADDGVYVGTYAVKPGDLIDDGVVLCTLKDKAGNQSQRRADETVTIDTTPPEIQSVEHDALGPLSTDEVLRITVKAEPGAEGSWKIGDFKSDLPLYDDGTHGDETSNDGVYTGEYLVRAGDNVESAVVSATLVKRNLESATKSALKKLTIDTTPPEPVMNASVSDVEGDSGFFLLLKWSASSSPDFDHYNVYIANMPITQLDRDPVKIFQDLRLKREDDTISTRIEVEKNDVDYYFAVTAVDTAGGESELRLTDNGSVAGPVRALDNLAPPQVLGLEAVDTPDDYGGSITLSWKEPSSAEDFDHYNVYLSREPIIAPDFSLVEQAISLLSPISQIRNRLIRSVDLSTTDEIDYYLAVTAVDTSKNESLPATVGPVQSINNIGDAPLSPIRIISGPVGQIRQRAVTFHWSPWVEERPAEFSFKLDSGNYQYTNKNRATFYNLQKGQHKFTLKTLDGEITKRSFNVQPLFTPESEPNNSPSLADSISEGAIVHGETADDADEDWYLLIVPTVKGAVSRGSVSQLDVHFIRPLGIGRSSVGIFRDNRIISEFTVSPQSRQRGTVSVGVREGEYQIRVLAEGENPSAGYELSASLQNLQLVPKRKKVDTKYLWEIEFNDQFEFATQLGELKESIEVTGGTNQENDVDWYKLNPDSSLVSIEIVRPESLSESIVSLYYQNPVIESNKIGQIVLSPANQQQGAIDFATAPGGYFLRVESSGNDRTNYELRITNYELGVQNYELEPNGDRISANEIKLGHKVIASLWHPTDDNDWYKINLPQRGILALTLECPGITGRITARLYDSTKRDSEYGSFSVRPGTGNAGYFDANLASGDYYVEISHETLAPDFSRGAPDTASEDAYSSLRYALTSMLVNYAFYRARANEPPNPIVDVMGIDDLLTVSLEFSPNFQKIQNLLNVEVDFTLGEMVNDFIRPLPNFKPVAMEPQDSGVYVGKYVVEPETNISDGFVLIELRAVGQKGKEARRQEGEEARGRIHLEPPLKIDTLPPKIVEVRHNGDSSQPFAIDDELKVRVVSERDCEGVFEVSDTKGKTFVLEELYDDGEHDDENPGDGIYGGIYVVVPGDNVDSGKLTVWLEDQAGNKTEKIEARTAVFIDTVPPEIEQINYEIIRMETASGQGGKTARGQIGEDYRTLRAGDVLKVMLTGEKDCSAEFDIGEMKKSIGLFDNGTHGDQDFGDGVYTNSYVVRIDDNVDSAVITGRLVDKAGNSAELESTALISIDTKAPQIISITHDAQKPLVKDDVLTVTLEGDTEAKADFDIDGLTSGLPLADDGAGIDVQANDGIYTGIYRVKESDNVKDATIIGHLVDKSGNLSTAYASDKVTIDAVAPEPITGVTASDLEDDEGNVLEVSWNASYLTDFGRYNIYREASPIKTTVGLIPLKTSLVFEKTSADKMQENTVAEIIVPANNVDYYIAVTVVDMAGNESSLGESSTFGPVQAKDNILPEPVRGVEAKDKPNDNGKTLLVSWKPLPLTKKQLKGIQRDDFQRYQVYVSTEPLTGQPQGLPSTGNTVPEELEPVKIDELTSRDVTSADVPVDEDDVDYYVAVTALDENGNESRLDVDGDSTAGPVRSHDEIAPEPVSDVLAVDTPSDLGGSISVSWSSSDSEDVSHYNIYRSSSEITVSSDLHPLVPTTVVPQAQLSEDNAILSYKVETLQDRRNYYVAVIAVDFGGNESELSASSTAGPVQSVSNRIFADRKTVISAGFDPNTKLTIPAHAAKEGQMVDITVPLEEEILKKIDEAEHYLEESHIDSAVDDYLKNTTVHFVSTGLEFRYPVEITISYELPVDIQAVWEDELRIFKLNENRPVARWELVQGTQKVDESNDTVTVEVHELGVFRIARLKLPENLDKVVIYPNPFIPSKSSSVTFLNLVGNSSVNIYTINGELVRTIEKTEMAEGRARWDGRNDEGIEVAGGLYVYVIKSETDKAIGKILLIR